MFGEQYGAILGKGTCERCGSRSKLRGLQRVNTPIIVCHTVCAKCHLVQFSGFTSTNELAYQAVKQKLENLRDKAEHPAIKAKLTKGLARLEENKKLDDLGIYN